MAKKPTIYQRLNNVMFGNPINNKDSINSYRLDQKNDVIFKTKDKDEYETMLLQKKQQKLINNMWVKANIELSNNSLNGITPVRMMYRDADLMDWYPEIGAALDIVQEESCFVNSKGFMVNVSSKSERIKSVIEDLLINRLDIHIMLPMICRSMCKYGNDFLLLNISDEHGIIGWKELPVYEMERYENGMTNPYISQLPSDYKDINSTTFVWVGKSNFIPYKNWQIAHFRLINDSLFLPYGVSYLHKARRHWRMLSLMEDMMLIYRLERSIERRVYKIYVGNIDDEDVQAYVNQIANNFKRTEIIDPATGQIDLRKNILDVSQDIFIPVRDENAPNPIDTLQAAQNLTAMDDIKFIQNKVLTALRIPKEFLNFENSTGDGKNLSMLDIRFAKTINKIQQALLMELTKIVTIHLYLLGFDDDLTNFKLSMNNPSSQSEMLELDNLSKKIQTAQSAVSDPGNGIQLLSWTRALKEILGYDDDEIKENLEEIRLEHALAMELQKTSEIISKTGIFDSVDRIYGDPNAEYSKGNPQEDSLGGASAPSGGGGLSSIGSFDNSALDGNEEETGQETNIDLTEPNSTEGTENGNEQNTERTEQMGENNDSFFFKKYLKHLNESKKNEDESIDRIPIISNTFFVNEELNSMTKDLNNKLK